MTSRKHTARIYELQAAHLSIAALATRDASRMSSLGYLHIDPRGFIEATDGHRLGRIDGVRWWTSGETWMRHPIGKPEGEAFWTEGPASKLTAELQPLMREGSLLIPLNVAKVITSAMKGKARFLFEHFWYIGVYPGSEDLQAVFWNKAAQSWQVAGWSAKDLPEYVDSDQVIPNGNDEAASVYLNGSYLADLADISKKLGNNAYGIRVITNHSASELEKGEDAVGPCTVTASGISESGDGFTLRAVVMPMRAGDTYVRRSRPAMPAIVPESPQEPSGAGEEGDAPIEPAEALDGPCSSDEPDAEVLLGQVAELQTRLRRIVDAWDGKLGKDSMAYLEAEIREARGLLLDAGIFTDVAA